MDISEVPQASAPFERMEPGEIIRRQSPMDGTGDDLPMIAGIRQEWLPVLFDGDIGPHTHRLPGGATPQNLDRQAIVAVFARRAARPVAFVPVERFQVTGRDRIDHAPDNPTGQGGNRGHAAAPPIRAPWKAE